jgi:predicted HicB family RNase H-like nuclease
LSSRKYEKKLNLTISEQVCKDIKKQAVEENKSVSEIVENLITDYLKTVLIHLHPK